MNNDGKCLICNQNLRIAGRGPTYYEDHETVADCLMSLAERVEQLESKERTREYIASHVDDNDWIDDLDW